MIARLSNRKLRRVMLALAVVNVVGWTVAVISGPGPNPSLVDYGGTALFGVLFTVWFVRMGRARLEVTTEELRFVRAIRTTVVGWDRFVEARVDYFGLYVQMTDGSVQSLRHGYPDDNVWLGQSVDVQEAVDRLNEFSRRRGHGT